MYKIKLANNNEELLKFENNRMKVFGYQNKIENLEQSPYSKALKDGTLLALNCIKDNDVVGGMLIGPRKKDIVIERLFVLQEHQHQGAGSFMLDYISQKKEFLEDYFGIDCYGIIIEPKSTTIDYYFDKGFDYSGFQMYKRF